MIAMTGFLIYIHQKNHEVMAGL